ncbi:unnamed protein product [Caenorhabditis angaria]|uniref:C2H2-type domain-containing protein n=1 Tax=Caenorhabditis angaria TaxID=860376 RepID=A0A9P1N003_9PELO|nr:unnamed protein product [Caenorhabditis angaria]
MLSLQLKNGRELYYLSEVEVQIGIDENGGMEKYGNELEGTGDSDLTTHTYEGGFRIWECTTDLCEFIEENSAFYNGKRVLELGCGAALPSILTSIHGASHCFVQDFNSSVIQCFTLPNFCSNEGKAQIESASIPWEKVPETIENNSYDVILSSETIYNEKDYENLHNAVVSALKSDGVAYFAAKMFYFGVGGNVPSFLDFVNNLGILEAKILKIIDASVQRMKDYLHKYFTDFRGYHKCLKCQKVFRTSFNDLYLNKHLQVAHQLVVSDLILEYANENWKVMKNYYKNVLPNGYSCLFCNQMFYDKSEYILVSHINTVHGIVMKERMEEERMMLENRMDVGLNELSGDSFRTAELRRLNYDPNAFQTITAINYDDTDKNNITCDFYQDVGNNTKSCIICNLQLKVVSVSSLLKHLRNVHNVFEAYKYTDGIAKKKPKLSGVCPTKSELKKPDNYVEYATLSNFFISSEDSITCVSCGMELENKTSEVQLEHIRQFHPSIFATLKSDPPPVPKKPFLKKRMRSFNAERKLTSFIISQGISYDVLGDPNLRILQRAMNIKISQLNARSVPHEIDSKDIMDRLIEDCAIETREQAMPFSNNSLITISMSFHCENREIFVAACLHNNTINFKRKNRVVFKKLSCSKLDCKTIENLMKNLEKEYQFSSSQVSNLVVEKKYLDLFDGFDENVLKFESFLENICELAENVLKVSFFEETLRMFNETIDLIRSDGDLLEKFELLMMDCNVNRFDISLFNYSNWYECLEMLILIVEDKRKILIIQLFSSKWLPSNKLSNSIIHYLLILSNILKKINLVAKAASDSNGTISSVIPLVVELIGKLKCEEVDLSDLIENHLEIYLKDEKYMKYNFATFLDPRYVFDKNIHCYKTWNYIKTKLVNTIQIEDRDCFLKELVMYQGMISVRTTSVLSSDYFFLWSEKRYSLPMLFKYSMDFLNVPMCCLNAQYYFGKHGKFGYMNKTMGFEQFNNSMIVASSQEIFKSRDFSVSAPIIFNNPISRSDNPPELTEYQPQENSEFIDNDQIVIKVEPPILEDEEEEEEEIMRDDNNLLQYIKKEEE